jgi:hypothetical protein
MSDLLKQSIWFGRLVLGAGALLFTQLGLGNIVGPVGVSKIPVIFGNPERAKSMTAQFFTFAYPPLTRPPPTRSASYVKSHPVGSKN